jgi:hypothetical protein
VDRILLLMMPAKYQPDYVYLRHVKTKRVHLFTLIQLLCFVGMWIIKATKSTAIAFPLMVSGHSLKLQTKHCLLFDSSSSYASSAS